MVIVKQELMVMYRRNLETLPAHIIAGLLWDVTVDATQFFYTFPSEEDFRGSPQRNIPVSQLSVRRSFLGSNIHIASLDTPKGWLLVVVPYLPQGVGDNALGLTRQHHADKNRRERGNGATPNGDGGGGRYVGGYNGGSGREAGRGLKRDGGTSKCAT